MEVIVKTTARCNGSCVYCASNCPRAENGDVPADRLDDFFGFFRPWFDSPAARTLRFTWHGGEPMLRGPEFYRRVMESQRAVFGRHARNVRNALQTNLTLLHEGWLDCLADLLRGQAIGTSFDVVDGVRGLRSGEPLGGKWIPAVRLLRSRGQGVGIVYVVHRRSLGRAAEIYRFFRNLDPRMRVRYNPVLREGLAATDEARGLLIEPEQYGEFLVELFDVWAADGMAGRPAPLIELVEAWNGRRESLCCDYLGRCFSTHVGVNYNGDVYSCGRGVDRGTDRLGNVYEDPLDRVLRHEYWRRVSERREKLLAGRCGECAYWELCHGGCPLDALRSGEGLDSPTYLCPARRMLFARMERGLGPSRLKRVGGAEGERA